MYVLLLFLTLISWRLKITESQLLILSKFIGLVRIKCLMPLDCGLSLKCYSIPLDVAWTRTVAS